MTKRVRTPDMIAIALLYRLKYTRRNIIELAKTEEFEKIVNENLDNMNGNCESNLIISEQSLSELFFYAESENGKRYAVIDPHADIDKSWSQYIGSLPLDIAIASQMSNALEVIGLERIDDRMVQIKIDSEIPTKYKRYKLNSKVKPL